MAVLGASDPRSVMLSEMDLRGTISDRANEVSGGSMRHCLPLSLTGDFEATSEFGGFRVVRLLRFRWLRDASFKPRVLFDRRLPCADLEDRFRFLFLPRGSTSSAFSASESYSSLSGFGPADSLRDAPAL